MGATLVVNPGSSSRKYALYIDGELTLEVRFESVGTLFEMCTRRCVGQQVCESITEAEFAGAVTLVSQQVEEYLQQTDAGAKLSTVVMRIVAPGTYFQRHSIIDASYISMLRKRTSSAPLHIPVILREIEAAQRMFPGVRLVAASDSAFHATMPKKAREYSLPQEDIDAFDIHRYGYHGLSVASVVRRLHAIIGQDPDRVIVCHIGNGVSVTAVHKGESVDTSLGFAPATGLPMGSRAGDVDTAALLELMRMKNLRPLEAEMYLHTQGGLRAMSGEADIRKLLDRRSQHDQMAIQALDVFAYAIQKTIAAMTAALAGVDVIVFTATAAVRSADLRKLITERLTYLGVQISEDRNNMLIGRDGVISVRNSPVKVVVMHTDEMAEMAAIAQLPELIS